MGPHLFLGEVCAGNDSEGKVLKGQKRRKGRAWAAINLFGQPPGFQLIHNPSKLQSRTGLDQELIRAKLSSFEPIPIQGRRGKYHYRGSRKVGMVPHPLQNLET